MALTIKRKAAPPPEIPQPPYTIFHALEEWVNGHRVGTLMLVHNHSGIAYRVVKYHPDSKQVSLQYGHKRKLLTPILSERESKLYSPYWR
jgi:hypothetical protein